MLEKLRLTPRQWKLLGKWVLYAAQFLVTMMFQTVALGNVRLWGVRLSLLPMVCCCVCLKEGPERGGIYTLAASMVWCLSGVEFGSMAVALWTGLGIVCAIVCRVVFNERFLPGLVCCFLSLWIYESLCFLTNYLFAQIQAVYYLTKVLPCVALSTLFYPLIYLTASGISKIGGAYGT